MATQNDDQQPGDNIVDADPDPIAERAAHLMRKAAEDAAFARAQERFAAKEREHADFLEEEGQIDESESYRAASSTLMLDAERNMDLALDEDAEVKRLFENKRAGISHSLSLMPDQSLRSLRGAVHDVREYVEQLSDIQIHDLSHEAHQSPSAVRAQCDVVIETGQHIENSLLIVEQVRRDRFGVAKQLVTFVAIAMEFAKYLPRLQVLMSELGALVTQFHPH